MPVACIDARRVLGLSLAISFVLTACVGNWATTSIAAAGKSLMPEGLEKSISLQEMANLLAYLKEAAANASAGDSYAERDFGTLPGLIESQRKP